MGTGVDWFFYVVWPSGVKEIILMGMVVWYLDILYRGQGRRGHSVVRYSKTVAEWFHSKRSVSKFCFIYALNKATGYTIPIKKPVHMKK